MEPILETMNDKSISQISKDDELHDLDFALKLEESFENELLENNHLNNAFICYDSFNNLSTSNICNP